MGGLVCFLTIMESDWSSVPVADWARDQGRKTERERGWESNHNKTMCIKFGLFCFDCQMHMLRNSQSEKGTEVQLDCVTARLSPSGVGVGTQKEGHDRKITFPPLVQPKMSLLVYTIVLGTYTCVVLSPIELIIFERAKAQLFSYLSAP